MLHHSGIARLHKRRAWPRQFTGREHLRVLEFIAKIVYHNFGGLLHAINWKLLLDRAQVSWVARNFEDFTNHGNDLRATYLLVHNGLGGMRVRLVGLDVKVFVFGLFVNQNLALGLCVLL